MSFTIAFRTGKDGDLVYGEKPQFRDEYLKKIYDGQLNIKATLGEMFTDFISMEGNIANSNHPFIQAAGDTCEGITSESYFLVNLREYIDLGIENKNFFDESCFMFFLESQGLHLPATHYTPVMKEGMEDKCVEDYIDDASSKSPLERMMRGFVAAKDEIYEVPLTTYECETVEDACVASLHFLITHNCNILKCQNCGKYFIAARSDAKYCDRMSPFNKNATCKEDGAQRAHIENVKNDIIADLMKKIKRKYYTRWYRNQKNLQLLEKSDKMSKLVDEQNDLYKKGVISEAEFISWLKEQ